MKKFILLLVLSLFLSIPIYAGYGSGDRIGADNPATTALDMGNYDINVTTINAKDSDGLYLFDDGGNGIFIEDGGNIGIGTNNPTQKFEIYNNSYLTIMGKVTATQASKRTMFVGARARGSLLTPLAVQAGDYLLSFFGQGYDGSGYDTASQIEFIVNENWTNTAHGSYIIFNTVDNGTTLIDERMRIDHNGNIGIGTDDPIYKLDVNGTGRFIGQVNIDNHTVIADNLSIGGTFYYNTSYSHGYATDVDVDITGSTSTFIILNPTWISPVAANGFTISGASVTYTGKGGTPKIFKVSGAFSAESDTVNTTVYWALFKNGVLYPSSIIDRKISVASDVGAMSISSLISLETGDILDVRLSGNEAATITNRFAQFDIIQIN